MEYKDYYKILGVDRKADASAIKNAYRRLARKFHPDRNPHADAENQFKDVQEAYEVLRDPEKRAAYDQLGNNWRAGQQFRPPPGWGAQAQSGHTSFGDDPGGFSDFFRNLFGGGGAAGFNFEEDFGPGFSRSPAPQTARVQVSLEEAYSGTMRTLNLDPGGKRLKVKIPAGVRNGQQIRLPRQAQGADLYLQIEIAPHPLFRVEERDVHLELPLAPWEAALGARVKVPTPGGTIEMKIPAGARSGQRMRLRGRGLPGTPPGDQFLHLQIQNPPAGSDEARALFEKMQQELAFNPRESLGV